MPSDIKLDLKLDLTAKQRVDGAIFDGIQEVFEIDIKGDAVENSPVDTGLNRRSIDTDVKWTAQGVQATIYTQSGYGGYLEIGTYIMAARAYIFPAFQKFKDKIGRLCAVKIAAYERTFARSSNRTYSERLSAILKGNK